MSWQDDVMIEQEQADALEYMGEAEWRDATKEEKYREMRKRRVGRPRKTDEEKRENKKEYNAKYWRENRERILEQRKNYYQINKDKCIKRSREWVEDNRDRWNEYQREWRRKKSKGGVDNVE